MDFLAVISNTNRCNPLARDEDKCVYIMILKIKVKTINIFIYMFQNNFIKPIIIK
jgi:hypothetical protein